MRNLRRALSLGGSRDGWRKLLRGRWNAVVQGLQAMPARVYGKSSVSDQIPAICECSPIDRRLLRTIPHLSSCCTDAPNPRQDTILGPVGRHLRTATVLPCFCREQQRSNNPNGCFNWFQPEHSRRNQGEPLSIRQMIEKSVVDHGVDRRQVFITGLSAGGAMASNMLACYPEVFAGGAIIAGLPYGAAATVQQAFETMFQSPSRSAREWGDLVRKASPHRGPWPRVSIWHGNADKTVIPSNALEILKQWTDSPWSSDISLRENQG